MIALLEMRDICMSFNGVEVLHRVDLTLRESEVRAIVGHNGAGKSTLMKILAGVHDPTSGSIAIRGDRAPLAGPAAAHARGIRMVFQEFSLIPTMSVLANVVLASEPTRFGILSRRRAVSIARAAFDRLGLDIDLDIKAAELSVGDRQLVEIAKAIAYDTEVLVLDEPTASLSPSEVDRLFAVVRRLSASGMGVLYISHHLDEIAKLCQTLTVLRDGAVVADQGVEGVTVPQIVSLMLGESATAVALKGRDGSALKEPLLTAERLCVQGSSGEMTFAVHDGEVVGLAGLRGSGRTETMEGIFGLRPILSGVVSLGGRRFAARNANDAIRSGLMLVPGDRRTMGLLHRQSVQDNLLLGVWRRLTRFGLIGRGRSRKRSQEVAAQVKLRFSGGRLSAPIETLSGGNQQKAVIGRALAVAPMVLMLDEPSAGIDVGARREILTVIRSYVGDGRAALISSSDLQELASVCDRILFVADGRVVQWVDNDPSDPMSELNLLEILHRSAA